MPADRLDDAPFETFMVLLGKVMDCVERHVATRGFTQYNEFEVYEDHRGSSQVVIFIMDLRVVTPNLVSELRRIVSDFPRWEVVITIALDDHLEDWPAMGLFIRKHEIIDGLQRDYFPPEFRDLVFEGAVPGGRYD